MYVCMRWGGMYVCVTWGGMYVCMTRGGMYVCMTGGGMYECMTGGGMYVCMTCTRNSYKEVCDYDTHIQDDTCKKLWHTHTRQHLQRGMCLSRTHTKPIRRNVSKTKTATQRIHERGYFSRTRLKCSFTVIKTQLHFTRNWSCNWSCTSVLSLLQISCNGSTGQVPIPEHEISQRTPCTLLGVPSESFVFREGGLTSWTVARKLQQAQCWRAA